MSPEKPVSFRDLYELVDKTRDELDKRLRRIEIGGGGLSIAVGWMVAGRPSLTQVSTAVVSLFG